MATNKIWQVYDICTASNYYFTKKPSIKEILEYIGPDCDFNENEDDSQRFQMYKIDVKDNKIIKEKYGK